MRNRDILAIGEILMDMTPMPGQNAYVPNPGGAPCNMAAMGAKMGARAGFIGKVGQDVFGTQLLQTLMDQGVDVSGVVVGENLATTLAFVHLDGCGERSFSFYRSGTADVALSFGEVDMNSISQSKTIVFGSVSLVKDPLRTAVFEVLKAAKAHGTLVVYDPNDRPLLWDTRDEAIAMMERGLEFADVLKVSEEEALLLSKKDTLEEAMAYFMGCGVKLVTITCGGAGVLVGTEHGQYHVPAFKVAAEAVKDTTGAGDAFLGAFVAALIDLGLIQEIDGKMVLATESESAQNALHKAITMGHGAAALCIQKFGAIPALPSREEVLCYVEN